MRFRRLRVGLLLRLSSRGLVDGYQHVGFFYDTWKTVTSLRKIMMMGHVERLEAFGEKFDRFTSV